jgi:protein TonB
MSRVAMEKPLPEPKPLEKARPRNMATIKNSTPVIMANVATTDPLPTVHELLNDNRAIGNVTQEGEAPAGNTADGNASAGSANGEAAPASAAAPEAVLHLASVMPEYPGGVAALHRFLARNLRVPENVIEPGQRINIPVRFVVNKTGELSDVEFLVQVNEPIKQEVLRVMRKMPAWKPGLQNGRPVAVYFTVPIVFEVSE